ncbi:FAD-binding-3 domain-containing protein [Fusarium sp. LHS14.1]|nr:FAD-binding-3 domain-containing protein [Fusarium sp. LHS14.1]
MESKPKAIIVGAGIAGLATAWWLDKAGWTSIIIERAASVRQGGYVISLSGCCLNTLKQMDVFDELKARSYNYDVNLVKDTKGREMLRLHYADVHGGLDSFAAPRGDLANVLFKALPATASIQFDQTLETAIDDGDKIKATLKGGETIEADLLIGTDGIRSSIRNQFWKGVDCLQDLGYSFAVYDIEEKKELEAPCVSLNSPGHLDVFYGLRDDRLAAMHIWRDDLAHLQERDDHFGILRKVTTGGAAQVTEILDKAEASNSTVIIDSLTMVCLPQWSKGRVLLLGDAAHCLTLLSGQGAGMALTSAEILGKALMATKDIPQALANHEKKLRPVIENLQHRSKKMAAMYIPKSIWGYHLRNLVLKIMPTSWIAKWHVSSAKLEMDLATVKI